MKRRVLFLWPSEWAILRRIDGTERKLRVVPKSPRLTWRDHEMAPKIEYVRQLERDEKGWPVYLEVAA